jgi:2-amino-4-hydroxy-6-hydroxymethyldihydropteridine diphosphokinase
MSSIKTVLPPVRIILGLGSNMGDRQDNLEIALKSLSQKIKVLQVSNRYDTAPVGSTHQARFVNLVCAGETPLSPQELLSFVKGIEKSMGRQPGPVNSPRPIDIDILFYADRIINTPELVVPHPRLAERAFVLVPLAEIMPDFIHPVLGTKISDALKHLQYSSVDIVKLESREVNHV